MKAKIGVAFALLILIAMLTACARYGFVGVDAGLEVVPGTRPFVDPRLARCGDRLDREDITKPDLVPINMKVCRNPEGVYVRWDIVVTVQNQGGNLGLDVQEAPVDVYVDFDPNRPYGYDPSTGEPKKLADYPDLLRDMPDQQYMTVPRAARFGGAAFSLWYVDGGPGYPYRRVPTQFIVFLDQERGGTPGPVDESNEDNNGITVIIDRYDDIGATGSYAIWCWYN